mmetsp:Transcript_117670/g.327638  ORF Transcript_117670/g.327638 Transcript_117670/m.327638 type:complete len:849 (-) Transcript_117670:36-2582(-)
MASALESPLLDDSDSSDEGVSIGHALTEGAGRRSRAFSENVGGRRRADRIAELIARGRGSLAGPEDGLEPVEEERAPGHGRFAYLLSRPVVHTSLVVAFAVCDGLAALEHSGELGQAEVQLGVVLAMLYVVLTSLLLSTEMRGRLQGKLYRPPWLLLVVLQACLSWASTRWCEVLVGHGEANARIVFMLGTLQLASVALYLSSLASSFIATCLSLVVACSWGLLQAARLRAQLEGALVLAAVGGVCARASYAGGWPGTAAAWRSELLDGLQWGPGVTGLSCATLDFQNLRRCFDPVLEETSAEQQGKPIIGTCLDYLVWQLSTTVDHVSACAALPKELQELIVDFLHTVLNRLRSTTLLQKIPAHTTAKLAHSSSVIMQYVNTVLNQDIEATAYIVDTPTNSTDEANGPPTGAGSGAPSLGDAPGQECPAKDTWPKKFELIFGAALATIAAQPEGCCMKPGWASMPCDLSAQLGKWSFDAFKLSERCAGQPIAAWGRAALRTRVGELALNMHKVEGFLAAIEERYCAENLYHNAAHAVDVANGMLYFLSLTTALQRSLDPFESFAGLVISLAHDVGHTGRSNRFHTVTQGPLALLFNDQSVLENMHCAVMFAVIRTEALNFMGGVDTATQVLFRNLAINMILDTDIAKHVQLTSQFRQEFLDVEGVSASAERALTPGQKKSLLSIMLKCADIGSAAKPFHMHTQWTMRIVGEFYLQGDAERALGLPCSPFCDRQAKKLLESQHGFLDFIVIPLFSAVADYFQSQRLRFEVLGTLEKNRHFWQMYDAQKFDYADPLANLDLLHSAHKHMESVNAHRKAETPTANRHVDPLAISEGAVRRSKQRRKTCQA